MIQTKELKTKEGFENLKKGDIIACNGLYMKRCRPKLNR